MNRLFSIRTAALVSFITVAGWQASVPGQFVDVDGYMGPAADGGIFVPMETMPEYLNRQQLQILDAQLQNKTESLSEQYAEATDEAGRKDLEAELAEVVAQHFTVRQAIRDREIANLEKEVARLRELLQQREDAKQQIVQGRVDQLIRSATGLGWDGQQQRTTLDGPGSVPGAPGQRMPGGRPAPNRH